MSNVAKAFDRALFILIGLFLAAMVVDVSIQVVFRYLVQDPPVWTEEAARYLFTWQIFLAAGLAFGRGAHITVDALLMVMPSLVRRLMLIVINTVVLVFLGILIWQGAGMTVLTSNTYSTALQLNMGIVYAALPVGAFISAVYVAARLVSLVRGDGPVPSVQSKMAVD